MVDHRVIASFAIDALSRSIPRALEFVRLRGGTDVFASRPCSQRDAKTLRYEISRQSSRLGVPGRYVTSARSKHWDGATHTWSAWNQHRTRRLGAPRQLIRSSAGARQRPGQVIRKERADRDLDRFQTGLDWSRRLDSISCVVTEARRSRACRLFGISNRREHRFTPFWSW
jgi:hypothetical protein